MQGLGERIRNLRKERKLTLIEVAKRTGIDQATLSRIENGVMIGTLNSHMKIAEVFSIPLPDLYEKVLEKINAVKEEKVKRKLETFSHAGGTVAELLTSNVLQKKMMPIILKFKPKGCTEIEEFPPLSERFIYVIKGSVEITADKETKLLNSGESFYFSASLPHSFVNPSKSEAICLSVMTPVSL